MSRARHVSLAAVALLWASHAIAQGAPVDPSDASDAPVEVAPVVVEAPPVVEVPVIAAPVVVDTPPLVVAAPAAPPAAPKPDAVRRVRGNGGIAGFCAGSAVSVAAPIACAAMGALTWLVLSNPLFALATYVLVPMALVTPAAVLGVGIYFAPDAEYWLDGELPPPDTRNHELARGIAAGTSAACGTSAPFVGSIGGCLIAQALGVQVCAFEGPSQEGLAAMATGGIVAMLGAGAIGTALNTVLLQDEEAPPPKPGAYDTGAPPPPPTPTTTTPAAAPAPPRDAPAPRVHVDDPADAPQRY